MLSAVIRHEWKLATAQGSGALNIFSFFVMTVTLFVFGLGTDKTMMQAVAPSVIWVCALLTSMLSLPHLLARDYEDGTLEQLLMQGHITSKIALAKVLSHWIFTGVPLIIIAPFLGYMLQMPEHAVWALLLSLILGSPVLSFVGAVGAALTLGTRRAAALLGVLVLPLYIPVLIFGMNAALAYDEIGNIQSSAFLLLLGLLLLMLPLCLVAVSYAIRMAIEES